jgi:hypothetical protein
MKTTNVTIIIASVAIVLSFLFFLTQLVSANPAPITMGNIIDCRKEYRESIKSANIIYAKAIKSANLTYKEALKANKLLPKEEEKGARATAKINKKTAKKEAYHETTILKQGYLDQYKSCRAKVKQ